MSIQNINPYNPNIYNYPIYQTNINNQNGNGYFSPYQTSLYTQQGVTYPFNYPQYQPKTTAKYSYIGQVKAPDNSDVRIFQLQNGHKVAIMPKQDHATIVKTYLNGGSMNENDKLRGISHTIEHCLFKGSKNLNDGDVFRLTGLMGASTNASTDYAQTDYYIKAPYMSEDNLAKTIQIQGDMISNPLFTTEGLETEKNAICSEISMMNDDVRTVAFDEVIRNLFQIESSSKNLVAGSISTVSNLKNNDLINHHKTFYAPNDLYTVVVGDVDVDKTINLIADNFTLPASSNYIYKSKQTLKPLNTSTREDIKSSKIHNTCAMLGFVGPKLNDSKSIISYLLLGHYLSTCSNSDLKYNLDKINGDFNFSYQKVGLNQDDPAAIVAMLEVNPYDEQKAIDIFYDAIQDIQRNGISNEDLEAMKNSALKSYEYVMCDSEALCDDLASGLMNNSIDLFQNKKEIINSITVDDIKKFANEFFNLNKVSMVIAHPDTVEDSEIINNYTNSKYSNSKNKNSLVSFCGDISKNLSTDNVREYNLQNNTHLVINETDSNLCVFKWCVSTPPIIPKNPNIPAVLAFMFNKGTAYKNQKDIERYKEINGIDSDVFVNGKTIEITADCLAKNAKETMNLMNELMYNPKLTQKDFEDAKSYVKDMLKASSKDANSNLLDNIYPGYFPTKEQKLKQIDELKLDDIVDFYNQLLSSASSSFVATLPLKTNPNLSHEIIDYQNSSQIKFKDSTPKLTPIYKANSEPNVIYDIDDLNQAQITKTYKFPLSGNINDEAKFEIVNQILGGSVSGRLFSDLREKENLAYSVYSSIRSFENTGILSLQILTTTDHKDQNVTSYDNVKKSLEGFIKHTNKLCNELVTDEELEAAKMALKQQIVAQYQNPVSVTELLSMNAQEPYGIKRIDKYIDAINAISKEDVKQAANFIFNQNPTVSIIASKDTINSQMNYLKTQGKVEQAA